MEVPDDDLLKCALMKLNKRSLIRKLSKWFPLPRARRIYFQEELIRSAKVLREAACGDADDTIDESIRTMWYTPVPVTLADIAWLAKDESDPGIRTRIQMYASVSEVIVSSTPILIRRKNRAITSQCCAHGHGPAESQMSARNISDSSINSYYRDDGPLSPVFSMHPRGDQAAMSKISELEKELHKLRAELAAIALGREINAQSGLLSTPVPASGPPPPPPPPCAPPPPPPPPPPPFSLSTPTMSVKDLIRQRRGEKSRSDSTDISKTPQGMPDLKEVLKGIGTVKLRTVKRSPGGTPLRQKPLPCNADDPASLIAQALKRKFKHRHPSNPETDQENYDGGFTPSPKKYAYTPPGPHLLKASNRRPFKRRSNCSPLREIN